MKIYNMPIILYRDDTVIGIILKPQSESDLKI